MKVEFKDTLFEIIPQVQQDGGPRVDGKVEVGNDAGDVPKGDIGKRTNQKTLDERRIWQ